MHFWIDKRSQQCGFGRSRVAASLSGAGSSGVGLSFGHPPRRVSSSGGSKSSSRSAPLPECHHSNVAGSSGSRNHQHQHQHQHQQQHQQQIHQASNNNNFNSGNNYQQSHTHSSNNSNYTSNSNTANITANASVTGAAVQSTTSVTLNNNPHQYAYQQTHHHSSGAMQSHHAPGNSNIMNNNNANTSTSTAIAADARGMAPPTAHSFNQRGAALLQSSVGAPTTPLYQQHANQCYDMRSYHHPQFGNMSVRHYQYPSRNCNGPTHTAGNSAAHTHRSGMGNNSGTRTVGGIPTAPSSMSTMQHMDSMAYRQTHGYSHATTASTQSNESIMGGSAPISTNTTNTASYAVANTAHRYSSAAINMRTSNMTVDAGGGDAQLLPSHLKCGMCASLVLASVFVAGAKFYFDHQGTGLEVLIFCAFSATFFLAACTVSLCRVPKGLLPSARNTVLGAQQQADADGGMHFARAPYGRRDIMSGEVSGELVGSDDIHGAPLCGQLQLIEDSESAGPPPYHIAIYFPETENSGKGKEIPIDDESPPPSYDKILI